MKIKLSVNIENNPPSFCIWYRTGDTGGGMALPLFCVAKRRKGNKGEKARVSKQKLLKGYHQGQNVTVLAILKRLEFIFF